MKAPEGSVKMGRGEAYAFLPTSIAAFKATNELLARGMTLYRAEDAFVDAGKSVGAGAVIMQVSKGKARWLARKYGLDIMALKKMPENVTRLHDRRIAVYGDGGVRNCLDRLGFVYDLLSEEDLNAGMITGYDLFINGDLRWTSLDPAGHTSLTEWFQAGGDYIGLSYRGYATDFANDAGIADVKYEYIAGNAIVHVDYNPHDSVAAGFS